MRRYFLCFLFLICTIAASAQDDEDHSERPLRDALPLNANDNPFIGGVLLGGNISSIINDYYPRYSRVGVNAGLTVYTRIRNRTWFSIELLYSQKGCIGVREVASYATGSFFEKYHLRLDYVEMPILLHAFVKPLYHITIGASYSYLLSEKETLFSDQPYVIDPLKYYSRKMGVDYILGGGLHLGKKIYLNIRYQRSLLPVRDLAHVYPIVGYGNFYNSCIAMQLMYMVR